MMNVSLKESDSDDLCFNPAGDAPINMNQKPTIAFKWLLD